MYKAIFKSNILLKCALKIKNRKICEMYKKRLLRT